MNMNMNAEDDYTYLFLDKAVENHHGYTHKVTKNITIGSMFTSNHKCVEGINAIKEFNKFTEMIEKIPIKLNQELYKPYLFSYNFNGANIKITIIAVNNKMLENLVLNQTRIPDKDFLISLCNSNILYNKASEGADIYNDSFDTQIITYVSDITKNTMNPNADTTDPVENQPEYCSLSLYEYQKKTIKWMMQREIDKESIYYNPNDEIIIGNVVYDTGLHDFASAVSRKKLIFSGGALTDEVGLGKTYQMITLSLQNQASDINYFQRNLTKLFSRATLVICPNHLGTQWVEELKKLIKNNYNLNVVPLFTKLHHDKCTYSDLLDADFVIVSFPFLENKCFLNQFLKKISSSYTYFSSSKSTYTYNETQNVLDELGNDALNNPNILFQTSPNLLLLHWHRIAIDEFHEIQTVDKYAHMVRLLKHFNGDNKWCMTATPFNETNTCLLSMFDFVTDYVNEIGDGIILNKEVREYLTRKFFRRNTKQSINNEYQLPQPIENTIILTFSTTEWMMYNAYLANPNVDKKGVLMRQLCCHPGIADEIKGCMSNCKTLQDVESVMTKHYDTQTKNALSKVVYAEYRLDLIRKKIKILEWKRQARILRKMDYCAKIDFGVDLTDYSKIKELEKIFANDDDFIGLTVNNFDDDDKDDPLDFDDDKELIIVSEENQTKIKKIISKSKYNKEIPQNITNLKDVEQKCILKIEMYKKDYDGKKSTSDYYNDVLIRLKKTTENLEDTEDDEDDDENKEQCGVCLGNIKGTDLGVTKCGHIFCYNCVKPFIQKKPSCPICQKPVKVDDLYMITQPPPEVKNSKEFKDKQTLVNAVGTKLANLIFFLKKNDKHCIIFSQWDDLLKKVGDVLSDYGIQNTFCKGNVWMCSKAVNEFNNDNKIKVIMLSSKSAASGMNLTKAEMVILLDPVAGTYKDRRNTEWQAIGRAVRMGQSKQVQIVRFIVKSTIEEDIYNENIKENEKQIENTKIFELSEDGINLDEEKINEINKAIKENKPKKVIKSKITKTKKIIVNDDDEIDYDYDGDHLHVA
jgi:SNF2 family DNA or RNA helicase